MVVAGDFFSASGDDLWVGESFADPVGDFVGFLVGSRVEEVFNDVDGE